MTDVKIMVCPSDVDASGADDIVTVIEGVSAANGDPSLLPDEILNPSESWCTFNPNDAGYTVKDHLEFLVAFDYSYIYFPWMITEDKYLHGMQSAIWNMSMGWPPAGAALCGHWCYDIMDRDFSMESMGVAGWDEWYWRFSIAPNIGVSDEYRDMLLDGGMTLHRLREGIERFLITDINNPAGSAQAQSTIPVMYDVIASPSADAFVGDWMSNAAVGFNHMPGGSNVLYMDGHVEFIKYVFAATYEAAQPNFPLTTFGAYKPPAGAQFHYTPGKWDNYCMY